MRTRYIQDPKTLELIPADEYRTESDAPYFIPDTPGYLSPVTGLWVEGRKARTEDLKRTGSRPYEGREQEAKEASRQREYQDQKFDRTLTDSLSRQYYALPEKVRRQLERN